MRAVAGGGMARVIVVGAGLAGLAFAYQLRWRQSELPSGLEIQVLEASGRPGGSLRTEHLGEVLLERGAAAFPADAPWLLAVAHRLGLQAQITPLDPEQDEPAWWWRGKLRPRPSSAAQLLRMGELSPAARMHLLSAALSPAAAPGIEETVGAFFRRQLGAEAGQLMAEGLAVEHFAGDPDVLAMALAFPEMMAQIGGAGLLRSELRQGRVALARGEGRSQRGFKVWDQITGLLAANTAEAGMERFEAGLLGSGRGRATFRDGMEVLPNALAHALGERIAYNTRVTRIEGHVPGRPLGPYRVSIEREGRREVLEADGLCLAVSAAEAARLVEGINPTLAAELRLSQTVHISQVGLLWSTDALPADVSMRGHVTLGGGEARHLRLDWGRPQLEGKKHRAARLWFGGSRDPQVHALSDGELIGLAQREVQMTLGITAAPADALVWRRDLELLQPVAGAAERLRQVERRLLMHPGLVLVGAAAGEGEPGRQVRQVNQAGDRMVVALRHGEGRGEKASAADHGHKHA